MVILVILLKTVITNMHQIRNVLYEVKKESLKRSSPRYQPNSEQDDLREELAQLRTQLRSKDTQIIRLQAQVDEMRKKITLLEFNSKADNQQQQRKEQQGISALSQVPILFENKELKENNENLQRQNYELNGHSRKMEADLRQAASEIARLETKVKQCQIVEKMRQERFREEVAKLQPIIVQDNKDYDYLEKGILEAVGFLREAVVTVVFEVFLRCAKECQAEKKVSSFTIFKDYWTELKKNKTFGLLATVKTYEALRKLARWLSEEYGEVGKDSYRDTMNEWVVHTLLDIHHGDSHRQKEQRLFRLLGLYYRSKHPIKGQQYELDLDVKQYFQDRICLQMRRRLVED